MLAFHVTFPSGSTPVSQLDVPRKTPREPKSGIKIRQTSESNNQLIINMERRLFAALVIGALLTLQTTNAARRELRDLRHHSATILRRLSRLLPPETMAASHDETRLLFCANDAEGWRRARREDRQNQTLCQCTAGDDWIVTPFAFPGNIHSTNAVHVIVHLCQVQVELLDLYDDGCARNSGITQEKLRKFPADVLLFQDKA
ncbi:hypothetical protein LSAT2_015138 [Lamellibrachia satsuma]|nr:hypothetical protein LSAT2_015138 [Lamellibrachia satsuma]